MADQIYRTSATVPGVWFLDDSSLRELDSLFQQQLKDLKKQRTRDLAHTTKQAEKEVNERYASSSAHSETMDKAKQEAMAKAKQSAKDQNKGESIEIVISDQSKELLKCDSFADAAASDLLKGSVPTAFSAVVRAGKNKITLSIQKSVFSEEMKATAEPRSYPGNLMISELERWAENHRESKSLCMWSRRYIDWMFLIVLVGWLAILFSVQTRTVMPNTDALRQQATQIVVDGINDSNRDQAISLLLQSALGESPQKVAVYGQWTWLKILIVTVISGIILWFRPRSVLGLGAGKITLKHRMLWYRALTRSLPYFVLVCIGLATLQGVLGNWVYDHLPGSQQVKNIETR